MNLKLIATGVCALALMGCDNNTPNPELLKGANFVSAQPGVDITLSFDPAEMRVYGKIVNLYNGGYTAEGEEIKFEPFASTMMMGEPDAMEIEQEYFEFMPTVEKYDLNDGKLILIGTDGKEIVFTQVDVLPGEDAPAADTTPEASAE